MFGAQVVTKCHHVGMMRQLRGGDVVVMLEIAWCSLGDHVVTMW